MPPGAGPAGAGRAFHTTTGRPSRLVRAPMCGRQRAHLAVELGRRPHPVQVAIGGGQLGGVGDAVLRLGDAGRAPGQGVDQQRHAQLERPGRQVAGVVGLPDRKPGHAVHRAGVQLGHQFDHGHPGLGVAGHQRPLDRRRPAPARQQ